MHSASDSCHWCKQTLHRTEGIEADLMHWVAHDQAVEAASVLGGIELPVVSLHHKIYMIHLVVLACNQNLMLLENQFTHN